MKESIYKILPQTDPSDEEFRDVVNTRREGETLGEHMARILDVLNIEVLADKEDIEKKLEGSEVVVINHPTSLDIIMIGALFGDIPYTVISQRKRAAALKKLFGDEAVCPVPLGHNEYKRFIKVIKDSLEAGRKLIVFPSGGNEISGGSDSWFPLYAGLLESDMIKGKKILPIHIDTEAAPKLQALIGDKENGREVFPELHYTIPDHKVSVPIVAGETFVAGEKPEEHYKKAFQ